MEIILGMLLGALLGGTTIYFLVKPKNQPEQQSPTSNSSRNLILKLIQSLPDIVIWVDGDNKIKYASEVALSLNIAREDKIQIDALSKIDVANNPEKVQEILSWRPRREKILVKDVKMRTFITNDTDREDLVGHVYDITYGVVKSWKDTLVIMDDSVVRGTTLKTSILRILDRLEPKRIILVSSAPQIRYPDCYGIDMSKMGDFAAFRAAVELLKDKGIESIMQELYKEAVEELKKPAEQQICVVQKLYEPLTAGEISQKIADMVKPKGLRAEFNILFQSVDKLHEACPNDLGDWYFTGNYPTPGGTEVANRAFVYYMEGRKERAY
jgi:amidophosphoribosyltransferase